MNLKFRNKKITGILAILPEVEINFEEEIDNYTFSKGQSMKLKSIMGYGKRRVVKKGTTVSDLCVFGMNHLFDNGLLKKEDIDAIVLITQSPDYLVPGTSYVIHGRLDLKEDIICMDINQACAGYCVGLNQAFMLLEQDEINKVVVMNADVRSSRVSVNDRSLGPLIGDGAAITIVENDSLNKVINGSWNSNGKGIDSIMIPAGGYKMPSSEETAKPVMDSNGNLRALDHLTMKGDKVFNFVLREVPLMVRKLLNISGIKEDEIDYYIFHQPNKFILKKLADKMGISYNKMPNNVVGNFGNSSSATIPICLAYNLETKLLNQTFLFCLGGFGAGLSWTSLVMTIGKLDFCEIVEHKLEK
ncbi:ketoacyl-ACP synthase III [Sediminicola arcticus]|jgi:3-oxoacyl-[acyl-carrier-protein] synthase-3|uniref:Ketoacyl-ACP synthase III n=1 Tax=Sediminicola arcticus TaxID=1574308 RepID=A0ABV2SUF3_9FLAO